MKENVYVATLFKMSDIKKKEVCVYIRESHILNNFRRTELNKINKNDKF